MQIAIICRLFFFSDYNDFKNTYEKVGEPTEAALLVLAEKINPHGIAKRGSKAEVAKAVRSDIETQWKKEITLEFSRDRKSMSVFCTPSKPSSLGSGPKLFVKGAPEGILER